MVGGVKTNGVVAGARTDGVVAAVRTHRAVGTLLSDGWWAEWARMGLAVCRGQQPVVEQWQGVQHQDSVRISGHDGKITA